jgi:hypothetical protein
MKNTEFNWKAYSYFQNNLNLWSDVIDTSEISIDELAIVFSQTVENLISNDHS